jgi:hypothetical protein
MRPVVFLSLRHPFILGQRALLKVACQILSPQPIPRRVVDSESGRCAFGADRCSNPTTRRAKLFHRQRVLPGRVANGKPFDVECASALALFRRGTRVGDGTRARAVRPPRIHQSGGAPPHSKHSQRYLKFRPRIKRIYTDQKGLCEPSYHLKSRN